MERRTWGWAGTVLELLHVSESSVLEALSEHHRGVRAEPPSGVQLDVWAEELLILQVAMRAVCQAEPDAVHWGVALEYELPLENGRRCDVVLLAGGSLVVVEFKRAAVFTAAALDQVSAYVRDLTEYHGASHGLPGRPILVLTLGTHPHPVGPIDVVDPDGLAGAIRRASSPGSIDLHTWLDAPYAPLPTLVEAARRIFDDEPLPNIRRVLATGIPEAVELLGTVAEQAQAEGRRVLAFVAGVPGSGKTLVGLTLVHQRARALGSATFLSGNGPLVRVLQHALGSKVFVRDLHGFIKTYGMSTKIPNEHLIVFDEAQRAWDRVRMAEQHDVARSEADLLVDVGQRLPAWAALVGLVGDGQEIQAGEEGGIGQWHEAIRRPNSASPWVVHCPPRLAGAFAGDDVCTHEVLDLTVTLRSRRAADLHEWIKAVLAGNLGAANRISQHIHDDGFPLWLTRSLADAKAHVVERYAEEPDARYGLVASSRTQQFLPKHGVDTNFQTMKRLKVGPWYNADRPDQQSCCALEAVVTEYECQGLELDLPIVCWGDDFRWDGLRWLVKPSRSKKVIKDAIQLRHNAYRVLLSRGRDGIVIYIPDVSILDQTEHALLASGCRPLMTSTVKSDEAAVAAGQRA